MPDDRCDVAVVGGGPAGSSAAHEAARLGCSVHLFEKARMPRHKLCGGAVSERALACLPFPLPERLIDAECYGTAVHCGARSQLARSPRRVAVLVCREHFDHFLVEQATQAGARLRTAEVLSIEGSRDRVVLATRDGTVTCRVAVIAEGTGGRLTRVVRRRDRAEECGVCLECRVPSDRMPHFAAVKDYIDVHFGVACGGYGWVFPHGRFYSVGIGGLCSLLKTPRSMFERFCAGLDIRVDRADVHGHLIPCGGHHRNLVTDGLMLAGDAAGFVDPFLGEGIAYAIRSGRLAGEAAASAIARHDTSAASLGEYTRRCDREFGDDLRYALRLARLSAFSPPLLMRLLSAGDAVLGRYLDIPSGSRSYREFVWWLGVRAPALWLRSVWTEPRACPSD